MAVPHPTELTHRPRRLFRSRSPVLGATVSAALAGVMGGTTPHGARAQAPPATQQATALVVGMELVYESGGTQAAAWRVEHVERNLAMAGRSGCLRVRFAPGGPRPEADIRTTCAADGVLYAWDSAGGAWRASRPIAPNRSLQTGTRTGIETYTTTSAVLEHLGAVTVRAIETTVLTTDSAGRPTRRLRERFAPALGTATWGAFEVPDAAAPGGWRVTQEFRLVAVRVPPQ